MADLIFEEATDLRALKWMTTDDVELGASDVWKKPAIARDSLAFLQYTSGSTGHPKGVMISHENLALASSSFRKDAKLWQLPKSNHLLSYLPLAHVFERAVVLSGSIIINADVSFVESKQTFADDLRNASPTLFQAVPLIWFVFQNKILEKLSQKKLNILLKIPLVSSLIKKKLRKALGLTRCGLPISGAASLPAATSEFFKALDIEIHEGYGQTENLAFVSVNPIDAVKIGTIGTPRSDVEIKIDPDSHELLVKSPGNMTGYYRDPQATEKVLLADGFIRSGDVAEIDADGYITIIGRLSEQFKTQKGEFITPAPIENKFTANPNIEFACLTGRELPQPILIVALTDPAPRKPIAKLAQNIQLNLQQINSQLSSIEQISHVLIVKGIWTPENGCLTPTQKIKRHYIEQQYSDLFDTIIQQDQVIVWEKNL